ncbi:MAG: ligase-associated DNA damage response exonuclease, partial [Gemmatimonadetes bacterium]|nr:ligase-associated DNA damage response exonuclease [Gemmatimonadota bacterium]
MRDLLVPTDSGLWCPPGGFHVDPWRPVERAVVTHAHSDHARPGSKAVLCSAEAEGVMRIRLGAEASLQTVGFGETTRIRDVSVSLHPAGHIRGSAQVRLEHRGRVWVVTGDYKHQSDPTCTDYEPVPCDVLITESTFGLPIYRWPDPTGVMREIASWWADNRAAGRTSVLFSYALGKAQRLLAGLHEIGAGHDGPILLHGAVHRLTEAYRAEGVPLPPASYASVEASKAGRGEALVIAPPSAGGSSWIRRFGPVSTAFASGWMLVRGNRRRRAADRGFVVSDHVDWPELMATIEQSGARRVGVTHGFTGPVVRYLKERGLDAWEVPTRFVGERDGGADDEG